jgi:hypothetical protein
MWMIALNIEAFLPLAEEFSVHVRKLIAELKFVPLAREFDEGFLPRRNQGSQ